MTTTANKHGLRKAAKERNNRHAQRTPLPPKPGVIEAARESDTKSWMKAIQFIAEIKPHGWSTTSGNPEGTEKSEDIVEVTAQRGHEVLWISWTRGTLTTEPMPSYTIADRTLMMRNASQCKQYAARPPEAANAELARVSASKAFRPKSREPQRRVLPFDPKLATDEELRDRLAGREVSWHNERSQSEETAIVGSNLRWIEIVEWDGGDRIVKFCCPRTGFRAFKVSALTRVGGTAKSRSPRSTAAPWGRGR